MSDFIVFKNFTGKEILQDALKKHTEITGVYPKICSEEYYLYSTVAYLVENLATAMEDESKQNFIRYAKGVRLDIKGELYGERGKRLTSNYSRTTIRCNISIPAPSDIVVAKGTRFINGNYIFYTTEDYTITKTQKFVDVIAVIDTPGEIEFPVGSINEIVDKYSFYESCTNITPVTGGREEEWDYEYRERLKLIPESFTTAGSRRSYEYWIKKASPLVTDVYIDTPRPNYIDIYLLNNQKLLQSEEKEKIKKFLEEEDKKALNDQITLKDPEINNFSIDLDYWVYENSKNNKTQVENKIKTSLEKLVKNYMLGDSINIQDFIEIAKKIDGVKKINVKTPTNTEGNPKKVNVCTNITLNYKGAEGR